MQKIFTVGLKQVGIRDIEEVGGKNASLGEMLQHLTPLGIRIPDGFVITVAAYREFIASNALETNVRQIIDSIDYDNLESLRRGGLQVRTLIRNGNIPEALSEEVVAAYRALSGNYNQEFTDVAVRSSATAEDLPDASFAGQQETYLNVRGPVALMDAVRNCFASLFTDRAISYRRSFGYDDFSIGLSICVQKMVRSDLGASGVSFSLDTESGFREAVIINGSYGLGEMIVQGSVSPDEFIVFKPTLQAGFNAIIEKKLGVKDKMMVYGDKPDERVRIIPTEKSFQHRFCINDQMVHLLAEWVVKIETYYSSLKDRWTPMDVEWAVDGLSGDLFIVQARPETIHSRRDHHTFTEYVIAGSPKEILVRGIAVGDRVASGKVNILFSMDKRVIDGHEFTAGDVLVTDMTDPDWEPIMKKASAIVTNKGGRTCHAAIVARELGIPAIVGCGNATEILEQGLTVTASCAEGETGFVYEGEVDFQKVEYDLRELPATSIPLMLNVASPSMSFRFSHLPCNGVGLAREEFIINNYIQVHPLALLNHRRLDDAALTSEIEKRITGYQNERDFFVKKLTYGIAKIAAAFYPKKVIVRFSDFKTNEYYNLLGGSYFEPVEENPMIGWRGASRYYSEAYKQAFGLECEAIRAVREELGLANVAVMIPFCRTADELLKVMETMDRFGLARGREGLELYLMAEVPSNIILADEFAKHIDGFSIGSNDLTQLTLGLDRDSALVAELYDERNEAVKIMISNLIASAKRNNVKVGICGQGPSDFPDFAQFLVAQGIDSISVTPDSLLKTIRAVSSIGQQNVKL
ncbi:phosphoenolpyruvate synthase [Parapedobacter lycopersici]|uniref:phosphoenolpyruvate synthase n=1 Tax=Parapedobacter lycopersici TaxID=1864939 RepID=UPI00333F9A1D